MVKTLITKLGTLSVGLALLLGSIIGTQASFAPVAYAQEDTSSEVVCTELERTLYFGLRDRNTDGEVSELQAFLHDSGYLRPEPSGFFGPWTYWAVRAFQRDNDIRATGIVGAATRDAIQEISCDDDEGDLEITSITAPTSLAVDEEGTWTVNVESSVEGNLTYSVMWGDEGTRMMLRSMDETQSSATFTHAYAEEGTYTPTFTVTDEDGNTVSKAAASVTVSEEDEDAPTITSLSATAGYAGDTITITGTGFLAGSDVFVGSAEVEETIVSDTSITFTVPSIGVGSYDVYVENENGTSNTIRFELQAKAATRISISGVSAPVRLEVNEEGTWTVNADTNASGNLTYSAVWGDENQSARRSLSAEAMTQTSATFTHTYTQAGTYKPTFTVSDGEGNSSKVSATVVVTE
jgi:PKD repeat protein